MRKLIIVIQLEPYNNKQLRCGNRKGLLVQNDQTQQKQVYGAVPAGCLLFELWICPKGLSC